jgi:hypothetical protein
VAEAISLGLDVLLLAGTNAGKVSPSMVPLLVDPKTVLVVSPLKHLQVSSSLLLVYDTQRAIRRNSFNTSGSRVRQKVSQG